MTKSRILAAAGIGLLAVVAILGWARRSEGTPPSFVNPADASLAGASMYPATGYADGNAATLPAYASRPPVRTIYQPPVAAPAQSQVVYGDRYSGDHRRRVVRRERPVKNSVAIVAGSAGVGAAIGALAGGGKGAGIGALVGGGGGLVYDRLTHKQKVE